MRYPLIAHILKDYPPNLSVYFGREFKHLILFVDEINEDEERKIRAYFDRIRRVKRSIEKVSVIGNHVHHEDVFCPEIEAWEYAAVLALRGAAVRQVRATSPITPDIERERADRKLQAERDAVEVVHQQRLSDLKAEHEQQLTQLDQSLDQERQADVSRLLTEVATLRSRLDRQSKSNAEESPEEKRLRGILDMLRTIQDAANEPKNGTPPSSQNPNT